MKKHKLNLHEIWNTVPPDYYQKGVKNNFLQKMWHYGKLNAVKSFAKIDHKKILDVGCASGWFLNQLSLSYPKTKCFGIDVYKKAINFGQKKYKHIKLVEADGHKIPYQDQYFDLVICTEVLEHVLEPAKVLEEIKRVLKKDGIAIIEMDTGNFLFNFIWFFWTHVRRGAWKDAHIHVFNSKKLEKMVKESGFKIIKKKIFNWSMAVVFQIQK